MKVIQRLSKLLSPCAVNISFIFLQPRVYLFDLGQCQGATEGKEYLLGGWDPFAIFDGPLCPGEGRKRDIPMSPYVATVKHTEVLRRYHRYHMALLHSLRNKTTS